MKLLIILSLFAYLEARVINENCDGVIVHNINHEKEILKDNIDSPYQLSIDYDTNMLFFSYSSYSTNTLFKSAYINLKTNEFQNIEGINGGFANGVDSKTQTVYLGGCDGLYKFDFDTKQANHIDGSTQNIWQIFFKNELYYTTYPDEHAYVFKNGEAKRLPELTDTNAMLIAFDNNDNIYFSNSSGLYIYKKAKDYISYVGEYNLNGITTDSYGNLFFSTPSGLYYIDDNSKKIEKLASIDNVYGIALENDGNIIYASQNSIVRLKPTKTQCIVNEKLNVNVDVL